MQKEKLQIGSVTIDVTFKEIKNLHLSVHPPHGRVTISSPLEHDLEKVKIYAATKLNWIKKEQKKFREQAREGEKRYVTRESHQFLGERYLMKVKEAGRPKIEFNQKIIELYAVPNSTREQRETTLYNWYRKELYTVLESLIEVHSKKMGLSDFEFSIRKSKTKWGSCSTEKRKLWFNLELSKKPIDCIEYIVVHELIHLKERKHNKRFILLLDKYLPNWRLQKDKLNELPI